MNRTRRKTYKPNKALDAYKDNIIQLPQTNVSYKKRVCGPRKKGDVNYFTCYTNDILEKIREMWNKKHPEDLINTTVPVEIWKEYQKKIGELCDNEECWLSDNSNNQFAPPKPKYENKNEWLSNVDIANVLKQYEKLYYCFEFLGPTPIDYNSRYGSGFVCNKIANFQLKTYTQDNKTKIGIVFNLDKHTQSGSHWVCLFINIKQRYIFYFDSVGNKMPLQIKKLVDKIVKQGSEMSPPIHFRVEVNKIQHQRKNNECGVYCLFVITTLLQDTKNVYDLRSERYPDNDIYQLRSVFFQNG
jgi:hypothetical protein